MGIFAVSLLGVLWFSCICGLMSIINFRKLLAIADSNISSALYILSSLSGFPNVYILGLLKLPSKFLDFFSGFFFLYFHFTFGNFYCYVFKLTNSFLSQFKFIDEPIKDFFISVSCLKKIWFQHFLLILNSNSHASAYKIHLLLYMYLFFFSIRAF